MSVNSRQNCKALLLLLMIAIMKVDALLIKQKRAKAPAKLPHKLTKPSHSVPTKILSKSNKSPKERKLIDNSLNSRRETVKAKFGDKSRIITKNNDKHFKRELDDMLTAFFPVMVVALMAYLMITAPYFGFLLFGLPLFLDMFSAMLGRDCKPKLTSRKLGLGPKKEKVMTEITKRLKNGDLITEGRKLLTFLRAENVQFGEPIDKQIFFRLLKKYVKTDESLKNIKDVTKQLKNMVDSIYSHKEKLADILNKAT